MLAGPVSTRTRPGATRFTPTFARAQEPRRAQAIASLFARVRRSPALAELRAPALAVWAGEVVLVAGVVPDVLLDAVGALHAASRGRVRAASAGLGADPDAVARALAAAASIGTAVAVAVPVGPDPRARHAVEALRRAVVRLAPCRCVWVGHGRTYQL